MYCTVDLKDPIKEVSWSNPIRSKENLPLLRKIIRDYNIMNQESVKTADEELAMLVWCQRQRQRMGLLDGTVYCLKIPHLLAI